MVCTEVYFLRICKAKIKCKFIASATIDFSLSITTEVVCKEEARGCWLCCYKSEKTINSSRTEAAVETRPVNYKFQAHSSEHALIETFECKFPYKRILQGC